MATNPHPDERIHNLDDADPGAIRPVSVRRALVSTLALTAGLALLLAAPSCSNHSSETASTTELRTDAAPSSVTPPLSVAQIELGRNVDMDQRVTERATEFAPNETVHASVITNGVAENAELRVRWTKQDGEVVDESVQTISTQGASAIGFRMMRPGLPAGRYRVEVFVNGQPAGSQEFAIQDSRST